MRAKRNKNDRTYGIYGRRNGFDVRFMYKSAVRRDSRIQESHILIGHIICCIVEEKLFGDLKPNQ